MDYRSGAGSVRRAELRTLRSAMCEGGEEVPEQRLSNRFNKLPWKPVAKPRAPLYSSEGNNHFRGISRAKDFNMWRYMQMAAV